MSENRREQDAGNTMFSFKVTPPAPITLHPFCMLNCLILFKTKKKAEQDENNERDDRAYREIEKQTETALLRMTVQRKYGQR